MSRSGRRPGSSGGGRRRGPGDVSDRTFRFLSRAAIEALHRETLAEHGGLEGIRDEGLLESAIARPRQRAGYEPEATEVDLAASLGFGLSRNHPFHDGNKRIALIVAFAFLELNGRRVVAGEAEAFDAFMRLAAGEPDEAGLARWIAANSRAGRSRR